jgi:hypothetical protein
MPPDWLRTFAFVYVVLSLLSSLYVGIDIFLIGHRQKMLVMDIVWPLTVLYFGPVGLIFYFTIARRPKDQRRDWQFVFDGASHCGAGCALGDFIGDWLVFLIGFTLLGSELLGKYLFAFVLAFLFGIAFQYFSIAPMRGLGLWDGLKAAVKVDTLSITAYQVGMFGWMAFRTWLYPALQPTDWSYWFMMQIAMVLGFLTTYPVNAWLIRRGTKERM